MLIHNLEPFMTTKPTGILGFRGGGGIAEVGSGQEVRP